MTTLIYTPYYGGVLEVRHGMEPHCLVVYFFYGVNLFKLGSE